MGRGFTPCTAPWCFVSSWLDFIPYFVLMRFAAFFFALLLAVPPVQAQPDNDPVPIQASDLLQIRELGDVTLSPDGREMVYTVNRIVEDNEGEYTYRSQLYVARPDGRIDPEPLTRTAPAAQPDWHPSSDILAFVRPVDGVPQIFVMTRTGGEPYQLTDAPHGATQPQWIGNGDRLIYASSIPGTELAEAGDPIPDWFGDRPGADNRSTDYTPDTRSLLVLRDTVRHMAVDTLDADTLTLADAELDTDRLAAIDDPTYADSLRAFGSARQAIVDTVAVEIPASPSPDGPLPLQRQWLDEQAEQRNPDVITRLDFQDEQALSAPISFQHYFMVDVPSTILTGDPERPEPRRITEGFRSYSGAQWMDGTGQLLVSAPPLRPHDHPDTIRARHLMLVDADTRATERFLELHPYALSSPQLSPDGNDVAFIATDTTDTGYAQPQIGLFGMDGRTKPELITTDFDRSVGPPTWSPDGWYLYTTAPADGGFPLYRFAPFAQPQIDEEDDEDADVADVPEGPPPVTDSAVEFEIDDDLLIPVEPERLTSFERGVRSFDVSDATAVYVITEIENPYELYASTADFAQERRLSSHNASWLQNRLISEPEPYTVTVEDPDRYTLSAEGDTLSTTPGDTLEVEAWLMPPTEFDADAQYPLLVEMHGGPSAMWGPGEATMWHEFQFMAGQGFGVMYSNPRGSGGYGYDFQRANYQDWGSGPMRDVLAATDAALETYPWLDANRQVLTGGSYAGYLTAWMVSQTDRFQAAVAQRGVYDLPTFLGEGNAWRLVPSHFGGFPWEGEAPPPVDAPEDTLAVYSDSLNSPRSTLIRNSPLTYVDQITTPLLIMHASEDLRTGVIQSEMLYRSLKLLDRPVEYVRYPGAGHDLSRTGDPLQRLDRTLRIYEFMTRFTNME